MHMREIGITMTASNVTTTFAISSSSLELKFENFEDTACPNEHITVLKRTDISEPTTYLQIRQIILLWQTKKAIIVRLGHGYYYTE